MPTTSPSNNYIVGISKQTAEGSVPTTEEYGMPVFGGTPMPVETMNRVAVTDANAVDGDPYKQGDQHWETTGLVVPGFAAPLGRLLQAFWTTDTMTGTTPRTHTFSTFLTNTPWLTMYHTDILGGSVEWTYEAGQAQMISFTADETGGPLRVGFEAVGKRPTVASYTNATPQSISTDGYFTVKGATLKYEADNTTPATEVNVQSFALTITRPVTPMATADGVSVAYLALGKASFEFTMNLLKDDHEMLRGAFFGAVGGSTPSATIPTGSVEINCVHTSQAAWNFKLTIDKVALFETPPQPNPDASPLVAEVTGYIFKPASGDHVKPVLVNQVATAYNA